MNFIDIAIAKGYTEESLMGAGALKGDKGDTGDSAYIIAVNNGFKGTEEEWLESLKVDESTVESIVNKVVEDSVNEISENISKLSGEIEDLKGIEPNEDDIPKVFIDGVIPTTKNDVLAEMTYISKTEQFHAYLEIKCQGSSSMSYSKKNFTIKMYSDEARETKLKKAFKEWGSEQNKYVLKANYIDHSHARNIVSARLWSEVVASRSDYDSLPTELKTSPNNGAIDGFPIKLYANGMYQGIYTWNIGKDDWIWNMNEDNPNHVLMCGETNTADTYEETACNFRALWSGYNEDDWSIEVGTNSDSVKSSLNALIACVKDADDETFVSTIERYLDLQSAIDYWIHQYIICGLDGLAKNMLLGTYDLQKWIMGAYDMDSTFGLYWNGSSFVAANYRCPEDYQEKYNLLFERITELYAERVKERYAELRNTVYSFSNLFNHFERFMDVIDNDLYAEDLEIYVTIPSGSTNNIKQIRDYIKDRLHYCDVQFGLIEEDTEEYIYQLAEPTVFDGTSTCVDTGVKLFDEQRDFTIVVNFSGDEQISDDPHMIANGYFTNLRVNGKARWRITTHNCTNNAEDAVNESWIHDWTNTKTIVLVFEDGVLSFGRYQLSTDEKVRYIQIDENNVYIMTNDTLTLGAIIATQGTTPTQFWKGTVHDFRVYNRALSEEEVNALILSY